RPGNRVAWRANAAALFAYPDVAVAGRRLLERLAPAFGDDPVLAMYGTDHSAPLPDLLDVIEEINRGQDGYRVVLGTLAGYIEERAATGDGDLPRWQGELRSSARANILMGVLSARVGLKAACARAERLLARYAEPFQALHGSGWPAPFLELGWRRLVESSGHDSITGCGADAVAEHVAVRLGEAGPLGSGLAERGAAGGARRGPAGGGPGGARRGGPPGGRGGRWPCPPGRLSPGPAWSTWTWRCPTTGTRSP